jgi:short-subunit dehydrogenase
LGCRKQEKERKMPSSRKVEEYGYKTMMKGIAVAVPGLKNSIMATCVSFIPTSLAVKVGRKIQENKH